MFTKIILPYLLMDFEPGRTPKIVEKGHLRIATVENLVP